MNFDKLHNDRKIFLQKNQNEDHVFMVGNSGVLISVPHAVSQVRLGKYKPPEIGACAVGLHLASEGNHHFIAKTTNNHDDANFDENSSYKDSVRRIINKYGIKYFIDVHGLGAHRECDVNLGVHLGKNIEQDKGCFKKLCKALEEGGFLVKIDQPFMAGSQTLSGAMKNENEKLWTLQIEINCAITNQRKNFARFEKLLRVLSLWINSLEGCK